MRAVPQRFLDALYGGDARLYVRCDVLDGTGRTIEKLTPVGGNVDVDEKAIVRRTASVEFAADTTARMRELVDLVGRRSYNELRVFRGFRYSDAEDDYDASVCGTFAVVDHEVVDTGDQFTVIINGSDRAWKAGLAKMTDAWHILGTYEISELFRIILGRQAPWLPTAFDYTGYTLTNLLLDLDDDPWEKCVAIANAIGFEMYVSAAGVARLRARRSYLGGPIVALRQGTDGLLVDVTAKEDSQNTWNAVVVAGEVPGVEPVRGYAEDDDPTSVTYVRGPMGRRPMTYKSRRIGSTSVANDVAKVLLRWATGWTESIEFTSKALPHVDEHDRAEIKHDRLGVDGVFNLESFNIPLDAGGTTTGTARRRRVS